MSDSARRLDPVESPCTGVCVLDESGHCIGCFRSSGEIGAWLDMSAEQRRRIMDQLPARADCLFDDG